MTIPLFYGIFFKKTPPWAAWTTMAAGMIPSIALRIILSNAERQANFFNALLSPAVAFSKQEISDLNIGFTSGVLFIICTLWYFGTMLFYKKENLDYVKQVDEFFEEMDTPIDKEMKDAEDFDNDVRQYVVLGNLCFIYGAFVLLLILIPNEMQARLCIAFCGLTIAGAGLIIRAVGAWRKKKLLVK
jgi:preprotein translocase subunit SecY